MPYNAHRYNVLKISVVYNKNGLIKYHVNQNLTSFFMKLDKLILKLM